MKNKRKVLECSVWSTILAITAAAAAISGNVSDAGQSSKQGVNETVYLSAGAAADAAATVVEASAEEPDAANDEDVEEEEKEKENLYEAELLTVHSIREDVPQICASAADGAEASETGLISLLSVQTEEEPEETEEETEPAEDSVWENRLMADVEDSLNVRAEASEDADLVGKLYAGAAADVIEVGDEWTKISSGNVEGYVKNDYCVYGADAEELAQEVCTTYATSLTGGLRVREEASTDSTILTVLEEGEAVEVDPEAETVDGWVAVVHGDETAYVSADYVEVETEVQTAITLEEEQEMMEKEAAAEAAAADTASGTDSAAASTGDSGDSGVSASTDDVTLLAALIYCEAGGESYEGQVAVGAVVVNRVQSSAYPNSVSDVIYQSGQFGPAGSGALAAAISNGSYSNCVSAAQAALSGTDPTGGATSFHAGSGSGTVIGNQTFY